MVLNLEMMMNFQITEYNETAAALAILRDKYSGPFDVTTTKGMSTAKEARAEVRGYRVALEKVRKEIKAPALERTRLIDAEAKRITAELLAIEEPIDQVIKEEEKRKEEEKAAKAKAEIARIAEITAKISIIRNQVGAVANQPSAIISAELDKMMTLELSDAEFQEFLPGAQEALNETRNGLKAALNTRLLYEAKQARLKAEREELARLREIEAARQAEQARIETEARQAEQARLKAEREAQEAEFKAQREEQQRQEQAARQIREAEEARLKAERAAMERQRAELEAQQRAIEAAKAGKRILKSEAIDPLSDLKQALNADAETANALDEAYQRGFQAGVLQLGSNHHD